MMISDQQMEVLTETSCSVAWKKIIVLFYALCRSLLSKSNFLQGQLHTKSSASDNSGCNEFKMSFSFTEMSFPYRSVLL